MNLNPSIRQLAGILCVAVSLGLICSSALRAAEAPSATDEAYAQHFPGRKPARSVARLGVDVPGVLISIDAIALAADG